MRVAWRCPSCQRPHCTAALDFGHTQLDCSACGWSRTIESAGDPPRQCALCGCDDLWRQKDFPPRLGLALVGLGALFSTIAWLNYYPGLALGILMGFALVDLALFSLMKDVLVCYRCGARHGSVSTTDEHPAFDLEKAERYRQERLRLEQAAADSDTRR
jgi:hypothetical protein